ncbi:unnamed protein product [Caenorhabditis angaria]|uniref:Uncharacterized protein n=1 Tax=Caenorhabditis angaria TaxID=860376 RepID=A0A9P1I629_9PELO|nr:unnamed protein product [Caenorhabditis angaria]
MRSSAITSNEKQPDDTDQMKRLVSAKSIICEMINSLESIRLQLKTERFSAVEQPLSQSISSLRKCEYVIEAIQLKNTKIDQNRKKIVECAVCEKRVSEDETSCLFKKTNIFQSYIQLFGAKFEEKSRNRTRLWVCICHLPTKTPLELCENLGEIRDDEFTLSDFQKHPTPLNLNYIEHRNAPAVEPPNIQPPNVQPNGLIRGHDVGEWPFSHAQSNVEVWNSTQNPSAVEPPNIQPPNVQPNGLIRGHDVGEWPFSHAQSNVEVWNSTQNKTAPKQQQQLDEPQRQPHRRPRHQ